MHRRWGGLFDCMHRLAKRVFLLHTTNITINITRCFFTCCHLKKKTGFAPSFSGNISAILLR